MDLREISDFEYYLRDFREIRFACPKKHNNVEQTTRVHECGRTKRNSLQWLSGTLVIRCFFYRFQMLFDLEHVAVPPSHCSPLFRFALSYYRYCHPFNLLIVIILADEAWARQNSHNVCKKCETVETFGVFVLQWASYELRLLVLLCPFRTASFKVSKI